MLEIGIGNGFVSKYLKEKGINILTMDIDRRLNPDIVSNITNIPFENISFDLIACYEILEHLPYEKFYKTISEIFRVSKSYAILSLPDASRIYRLYIQIPKLGIFRRLISLPRFEKLINNFNDEHYWEIGKDSFPFYRIIKDIESGGFKIVKTYRVFKNPYY